MSVIPPRRGASCSAVRPVLPFARASLLRLLTVEAVAIMSVACGHHTPTQPPPPTPVLECPGNVTAESLDGNPTPVTFSSPNANGGTPPYTITCTPPSGAAFAVGTTPVECSVVDSKSQYAICAFSVRMQPAPKLSLTRFLAFGDSLTYGVTSASPTLLLSNVPDSYPTKLQLLLQSRYQTQNPVVLNDGIGGERVFGYSALSPGGGIYRFPHSVADNPSDVVLLMEGTNDLLNSYDAGIPNAIKGLREMVDYAKSKGLRVFLATIPPIRSGGARHRDAAAVLVPGFDDQVRALAADEGIPLVDVYNSLVDKMYLIGVDDLHPTPQGYDVIAGAFRDSIKANLEEPRPLRAH